MRFGASRLVQWCAAGLLMVGVGLSVAACSPATRNNVAVFLDEGHPTAVLHPCPGEAVTELSVTDRTTPSAPSPGAAPPSRSAFPDLYVPYWHVKAADATARPTEVRLLTVPAGWTLSRDIVFRLRTFDSGSAYSLGTGQVGARDVDFTLADLEALSEDQVWALSDQGEEKAMTRDEFARVAESHCD